MARDRIDPTAHDAGRLCSPVLGIVAEPVSSIFFIIAENPKITIMNFTESLQNPDLRI